jgi:hypothetical protein
MVVQQSSPLLCSTNQGDFVVLPFLNLGGWEIVPPLYCSAAKSAMAGLQYAESDKPCSMFGC